LTGLYWNGLLNGFTVVCISFAALMSNCWCCYVQVREDLEAKAGKQFVEFVVIEYSTQVVAGTNYFVKV